MVMLAAGDADGDGADDLAIGFPDLTVDAKEQVGAVAIVPGGPDGLDATQAQTFSQDSPGVPGEACGVLRADISTNGSGSPWSSLTSAATDMTTSRSACLGTVPALSPRAPW